MFGDDFLSNIGGAIQGAAQNITKDVAGFVSGGVKEALVRIGPKPTGNLSQAEIDAGLRGGGGVVLGSGQNPGLLANAASSLSSTPMLVAVALAVGLGAYFVFGRK